MYGYIYETVDTKNGKTYIGQHRANKFDKNYHGSGKLLLERIKEFGVKGLETRFVESADNADKLNELEVYYIAEGRKNGKCEYNLAPGGAFEPKTLNYIRITKDGKERAVPKDTLSQYLSEGWEEGRAIVVHNTGKIGIHKSNVNKYIYEDELQQYLSNGWEEGFVINYKETSTADLVWIHNDKGEKHMVTPEDRATIYKEWKDGIGNHTNNYVSEKYLRNSLWIHKGKERKRIPANDRSKYPDWEDGIGPIGHRKEKQIWIHKENKEKFIYVSERNQYPDWEDGISPNRKSTIWINNGNEAKCISTSDRNKYPDWEDGQGNCSPLKGKRMWINNGSECKYILVEDRNKYPNWNDGQGKGTRKRSIPTGQYMWINNGEIQTRIIKSDRDKYPDWCNGRIKNNFSSK